MKSKSFHNWKNLGRKARSCLHGICESEGFLYGKLYVPANNTCTVFTCRWYMYCIHLPVIHVLCLPAHNTKVLCVHEVFIQCTIRILACFSRFLSQEQRFLLHPGILIRLSRRGARKHAFHTKTGGREMNRHKSLGESVLPAPQFQAQNLMTRIYSGDLCSSWMLNLQL